MKIASVGIDLPEGKVKYEDKNLTALENKDKPKKVSPFFAEFIGNDFAHADVIVVPEDKILDLLILDMEKIETRLNRLTNENEKKIMLKCQDGLDKEIPLCDIELTDEEKKILETADTYSLKPVAKIKSSENINTIIRIALEKARFMFFYTSGPTESHAWLVKKGSEIIDCAAKIHSDLARGFIKGDVVSLEDYLKCHNFTECKSKGLAKVVDRRYIVQPGEIIEIRFNV